VKLMWDLRAPPGASGQALSPPDEPETRERAVRQLPARGSTDRLSTSLKIGQAYLQEHFDCGSLCHHQETARRNTRGELTPGR